MKYLVLLIGLVFISTSAFSQFILKYKYMSENYKDTVEVGTEFYVSHDKVRITTGEETIFVEIKQSFIKRGMKAYSIVPNKYKISLILFNLDRQYAIIEYKKLFRFRATRYYQDRVFQFPPP